MFKQLLTAVLIIAATNAQIDCTDTLQKDAADLYFLNNLAQSVAASTYYPANAIEACIYTYSPGLSNSCLQHKLIWQVSLTDVVHTHIEDPINDEVTVEWNLTETLIANECTDTQCLFTTVWYDWRIYFREHNFELMMYETVSNHTIELNVNWVILNLGCSGNCQNLTGEFTELFICTDNTCATSVQNNQVLTRTMGDNVTCVVVIIIPELAAGHTLTLEQMTFTDPAGNEVTVYSSETQQLGQYILAINFPFPCLACSLEIISRRTAFRRRNRMLTTDATNFRELQNTDTDAVTLDLSVTQAGTATSEFNWLLIILLLILFLIMICCYMFFTKKKEKKGQEVNPKSKQTVSNKH